MDNKNGKLIVIEGRPELSPIMQLAIFSKVAGIGFVMFSVISFNTKSDMKEIFVISCDVFRGFSFGVFAILLIA